METDYELSFVFIRPSCSTSLHLSQQLFEITIIEQLTHCVSS